MRRKLTFGLILMIMLAGLVLPGTTRAQMRIPALMNQNQIAYAGPGTSSVYLEYLAEGRWVVATGRNTTGDWIELDLQGLPVWVPANVLDVLEGDLSLLPVREGWLPSGAGAYSPTNRHLRSTQLDMILVQRSLYSIAGRYNFLQGGLPASCDYIPAPPAPPSITDAEVAAVPELDRVRRELTWVADRTGDAIAVYRRLCSNAGGAADPALYLEGLTYQNEALEAYHNIRKYLYELTDMQKAAY